jgi:hypothetical protein
MPQTSMNTGAATADRREAVLTTATVRAADLLRVSNTLLGAVIGVSAPTVSRMKNGGYLLTDGSKPFEMAQLFLRLFRSLDSIVGGDDEAARSWLTTENRSLGGRPIDLIQKVVGLVATVTYLDTHRAVL